MFSILNKTIFLFLAIFFAFFVFAVPAHATLYNATNLLGQTDASGNVVWTKSAPNNGPGVSGSGFNGPSDVAYDSINHRLFVVDSNNNRVLVYSIDSNDNIVSNTPLFVIGQTDFTSSGQSVGPSGLYYPASVAYDSANSRLFVSDYNASRVLAFNVANGDNANGRSAIFVLGETDFNSIAGGHTQSTLFLPLGIAYDVTNSRLFVADFGNHRVVAFSVPAGAGVEINGENALFEIGQSTWTNKISGTTQRDLYRPMGLAYDQTNSRLFVGDGFNYRVMAFSVPNNDNALYRYAIFVLGQPDFITADQNTTQNGLSFVIGTTYDSANSRLFVSDSNSDDVNRVMAFSVPAGAGVEINGENAIFELGQADFTSGGNADLNNAINLCDIATTKSSGLAYDSVNLHLFVADTLYNRIMVFPVSATATSSINGENASYVFGHYDITGALSTSTFLNTTANGAFGVNSAGFDYLNSIALDTVNHRLFVSEENNRRILIFQLDSFNNIASRTPINVLGASDINSAGPGTTTSSTFTGTVNLAYDSDNSRLFVALGNENRILVFNVNPTTIVNGEAAMFEIGQPAGPTAFTSYNSATTQSGFTAPDNMDYDSINQRLFVADQNNRRVLAFNVSNSDNVTNGRSALFVIGQTNFTSKASAQTQSGFYGAVVGIAYDHVNSRLFVSSWSGDRITAYSVPNGDNANGRNAIFVLGQPDFTSSGVLTTQSGTGSIDDLNYNSATNQLFAGDMDGHRVMIWDVPAGATSSFNYAPAREVIGQADWTSNGSGTSQSSFYRLESPHAFDPVNNVMYNYELRQYRVLQFNFIHITTASFPSGMIGASYSQPISVTRTQGLNQAYSIYSGSLPSGLSLNTSTGVISGTPTTATTTSVTIEARDNSSTGYLFDRATYTLATTLSSDATLSNLAVSSGTLSPTFSSATTSYTDSVGNGVTSITVTPTVNQANATVTVNGTTVSSGSASGSIPLSVGSNTVTVVVTAQDTTTKTYTIGVNIYSLTYSSDSNGSISGSSSQTVGSGNSGTSVTAVPNSCFSFVKWSDNSTQNPRTDTNVTTNISVSASFGGSCGGGLPTGAYMPPITPSGGFGVIINGGTPTTSIQNVVLTLRGGVDTVRMVLSNNADFQNAIQEPYVTTKDWTLSAGSGTKTVYAKFYTQYGQSSSIVLDTITFNKGSSIIDNSDNSGLFIFLKNLYFGMRHADVIQLKIILASEGCVSGLGNTNYFGPSTLAGVKCFQDKYKAAISAITGYTIKSTGFVGNGTRVKLNEIIGKSF